MLTKLVGIGPARSLFKDAAIDITAIGVLAHRAVEVFSGEARPGPSRARLTQKVDNTEVMAYWLEAVAAYAAAHPKAHMTALRSCEDGWPEFNIDNQLHLRVERQHRPDASPRRAVRERQGPDTWAYDTLFEMSTGARGFTPRGLTFVDLTATFDQYGQMAGATVTAPNGLLPLWRWEVTTKEAAASIRRWRALGRTPWLDDIDRLASMRVPRALAPTAGGVAATAKKSGRRFTSTPTTLTPTAAGIIERGVADKAGLADDGAV